MKHNSFWKTLTSHDRYMIGNLFFLYLIQGIFVILIGCILPMMREDYGLDYQVGGLMISAHSVGNTVAGLCASILPLIFGLKRSLLLLNIFPFAGLALTLVTGNPVLLIVAMLINGLGRGAISNYNNQAVSALSGGSSVPLNALHGFFAIGAVSAPFLALLCSRIGTSGWRYAVGVVIALGAVSMVTSAFMKMDSVSYSGSAAQKRSIGFFRERPYVYSMVLMFFYLCVEASVMGWMVSYYIDTGVVEENSAQLLTSLLWVTILIGRFVCSALGSRMTSVQMIRVLSTGIAGFLLLLLISHSLPLMLIGTVGLGLSMSGMYGTTVANAGDVFGRYPLAMGVFILIPGLGSVIMPAMIGAIAERASMHLGMSVLLAPAAVLFVLALRNRGTEK